MNLRRASALTSCHLVEQTFTLQRATSPVTSYTSTLLWRQRWMYWVYRWRINVLTTAERQTDRQTDRQRQRETESIMWPGGSLHRGRTLTTCRTLDVDTAVELHTQYTAHSTYYCPTIIIIIIIQHDTTSSFIIPIIPASFLHFISKISNSSDTTARL